MGDAYWVESFTDSERSLLAPHVSSLDGPVFTLRGLPQATCAALFARYSRSAKSLRRLLLDEFLDADAPPAPEGRAGQERARDLFGRVLAEYGDDSVAQLAGVHIACEQVSQLLAKAIEWGRLASYLEQSTRYIPYTDRRHGHFRYRRDPAVLGSRHGPAYLRAMDGLFEAYSGLITPLREHLESQVPGQADPQARRRAIRALALDVMRGLLPAGTVSNVGVFASPQALEQMVLRLRGHPLAEARSYAELIATELQAAVPDFVTRLDRADRGGVWAAYLRDTAASLSEAAEPVAGPAVPAPVSVRLVRWEADAEDRIIAAALYPHTQLPEEQLVRTVRGLPAGERERLFVAATGERRNRRHRPGRGFEHCDYTFELVSDYGAFRDLQRHRMLTIQWQELTPTLGYEVPAEIEAAGLARHWRGPVEAAETLWREMRPALPQEAAYLVTLGHRVRYLIKLNAREAMHLIELRTSPQGHPSYRRLGQEMHRLIAEVAGHNLVAGAMAFVGSEDVHLPRYAAEAAQGPSA